MTTNVQLTPTQSETLELLRRMTAALEAIQDQVQMQSELIKRHGDTMNALCAEILFDKRQVAEAGAKPMQKPVAAAPNDAPWPVAVTEPIAPINGEKIDQFVAVKLSKGVNEKTGEIMLRAIGGKWMTHGVPIYPETAVEMGIQIDTLQFGQSNLFCATTSPTR
jgi:hypothetical protein